MRLRNYVGVIGFVVFIAFISSTSLYIPAGIVPIAFWEYPVFIIVALIGTFFLNTFIEYGVLYDISRSHDVNKRELLLSVIVVNLITFPAAHLTLYFSLAFTVIFLLYFGVVIEIMVIIIEWILYRWEFQKLLSETPSKKTPSSKTVLSISAIINILSFLIIGIIDSYLINVYFMFGMRYF